VLEAEMIGLVCRVTRRGPVDEYLITNIATQDDSA
jgi:hypothetical protein